MSKVFKVLVTHAETPKEALDVLKEKCDVIQVNSVPAERAEVLEKIKGVDGVLWTTADMPLDAEILDAAGPQLKVISTASAGYDFVDLPELRNRNIRFGYAAFMSNDAVAEVAVGLAIAAARRFHEGRLKIDSNKWENYHLNWMLGRDIAESIIGFYGFGGIGRSIACHLHGFGVERILYTSRKRAPVSMEAFYNARNATFEEMIGESDFIFIVSALTDQTVGKFNATVFDQMKKTAVLINIAHGKVINMDELYDALRAKKIYAVGLDVMDPEPLPGNHKLLQLPNVVVTPHLGSATECTRRKMAKMGAENVVNGLLGKGIHTPFS